MILFKCTEMTTRQNAKGIISKEVIFALTNPDGITTGTLVLSLDANNSDFHKFVPGKDYILSELKK